MRTVGFIARLRKDFEYRAYIGSTVSFFASLAFMGYNIFLGAVYGTFGISALRRTIFCLWPCGLSWALKR